MVSCSLSSRICFATCGAATAMASANSASRKMAAIMVKPASEGRARQVRIMRSSGSERREGQRLRVVVSEVGHLHTGGRYRIDLVPMVNDLPALGHKHIVTMDKKSL